MSDPTDFGHDDWRRQLLITPTHKPVANLANAITALSEAPEWHGVLAHDAFTLTTKLLVPPPWVKTNGAWTARQWTDTDDTKTAEWLQHQGIGVNVNTAAQAADAVAKMRSFHPVRDYLEGLQWDQVKRLDTFVPKYLGAGEGDYQLAVGRCLGVASVARIMRPGCKFDHVVVLEAGQGALKTTTVEALYAPWFTCDLADLGTKAAAEQLRGVWGVELAELSAMARPEVERVKAFVSRTTDRFRPSYGRHVVDFPRQCIFVGTTNADFYLKDDTGGRRFWPVTCGAIDIAAIRRERDMLWAEAVALFNAGEPWWFGADTAAGITAVEEQDARYAEDAWHKKIARYLGDRDEVQVEDILMSAIDKPTERWTQLDQMRVTSCLKRLGFKRKQGPRPDRIWAWRRQ